MSLLTRTAAILAVPFFATLLVNAGSQTEKLSDVTLLGCLSQGDQPKQFIMKSQDKTYILRSSSVNLAKHVGQTVSVSGSLKKAETGETGQVDRFKVSSLSKVSNTCQ
jgi:hypothetical protein